jgi:hypothetical protein
VLPRSSNLHFFCNAGQNFRKEWKPVVAAQIRRDNHKVAWQCGEVKLPNAEKAIVEHSKVVDYLLNPAHPDNGGKAAFFEGLGFQRQEWKTLARSLRALAARTEVTSSKGSSHGRKYIIVGRIESPSGKAAMVRTIWIVDRGLDSARLVTAYPHKT